MKKRYITIGLDDGPYNELEFISRQMGYKHISDMARHAVYFLILYMKSEHISAHLNDKTEFQKEAANVFYKMYGMKLEDVQAQKQQKVMIPK